jgi:hypothetical protein
MSEMRWGLVAGGRIEMNVHKVYRCEFNLDRDQNCMSVNRNTNQALLKS